MKIARRFILLVGNDMATDRTGHKICRLAKFYQTTITAMLGARIQHLYRISVSWNEADYAGDFNLVSSEDNRRSTPLTVIAQSLKLAIQLAAGKLVQIWR